MTFVTFVLAGQIRAQCGMDFVSKDGGHATLLWHLWHGVVSGQLCHTVTWVEASLEGVFRASGGWWGRRGCVAARVCHPRGQAAARSWRATAVTDPGMGTVADCLSTFLPYYKFQLSFHVLAGCH